MSNTITYVTPTLLAQGLKALREQAVMPRLVNRSLDSMAAMRGNVINVPLPSAITARAVTPSQAYATNQDFSPTSVAVTLDFWYEASFQLSDSDMKSCIDGIIPMQASEAIRSLANAVDEYIMGKYTGIYGAVGTAGTTPFASGVTVANAGRTLLNTQVAPPDMRSAVLDPAAEGNLLGTTNVLQFDQRGDQGGIINGTIGRKLGFDWYMNQNVVYHTAGTAWVTGWTAESSSTVAVATLSLLNSTATGTINVGDLFTIAGASQQYVVNAAATVASSAVNITFAPALVSAVATAAAITVVGSHRVNLGFHRDAFAWASRPLADVQGLGNNISVATDPVSGIALRLEVSRQYKQTTFSYDILGGAALVRPALGVRILG
jgi:hypothetical protein